MSSIPNIDAYKLDADSDKHLQALIEAVTGEPATGRTAHGVKFEWTISRGYRYTITGVQMTAGSYPATRRKAMVKDGALNLAPLREKYATLAAIAAAAFTDTEARHEREMRSRRQHDLFMVALKGRGLPVEGMGYGSRVSLQREGGLVNTYQIRLDHLTEEQSVTVLEACRFLLPAPNNAVPE